MSPSKSTQQHECLRLPLVNGDLAKVEPPRIAFFGHFGLGNFGNESTLQAMLVNSQTLLPVIELSCICTGPETVGLTYGILAAPVRGTVNNPWEPGNPVVRLIRKAVIGIPREVCRWAGSVAALRGTKAFVVPGTGLLNDAFTLFNWGPYDMFRWTVAAKLCRCKIFFVSVGAGPLYSRAGRFFVKAALRLADFRSYRDESSQMYLKSIGLRASCDPVYPDLAFSLLAAKRPHRDAKRRPRRVVGVGVMPYAGRYSVERPKDATYVAYLACMAEFVEWLLGNGYDVRLLIGDVVDLPVKEEFRTLLKSRCAAYGEERIIDEPVASVEVLLSQIASTDFVVATRFHNVLLSLLLNKPSIAISFHHKCASLMSQMGLSEYCLDINSLKSEELIAKFRELEQNAARLKPLIQEKVEDRRKALEEQYRIIFQTIFPGRPLPEGLGGEGWRASEGEIEETVCVEGERTA